MFVVLYAEHCKTNACSLHPMQNNVKPILFLLGPMQHTRKPMLFCLFIWKSKSKWFVPGILCKTIWNQLCFHLILCKTQQNNCFVLFFGWQTLWIKCLFVYSDRKRYESKLCLFQSNTSINIITQKHRVFLNNASLLRKNN